MDRAPPVRSGFPGPRAARGPEGTQEAGIVAIAIAGQEASKRALELLRAGENEGSLALFEEALRANPYQSSLWYGHGDALQKLGRYDEAIESFEQAVEVGGYGWHIHRALFHIAGCHAQLDQKDDAFAVLARVMRTELGTNASMFRSSAELDSLRDDPRWSVIVPIDAPSDMTREEGWRYDLGVFKRRIKDLHYDFEAVTTETAFDSAIASLHDRIGDLSDDAISLEIQRVLASLGDGHTTLVTWPSQDVQLPLAIRLYSDGLFVLGASGEHADVAGWRVVRIGGREASQVLASIEPYVSRDNQMGVTFVTPALATRPTMLHHLGLVEEDGAVEFEFEDHGGKRHTRRVVPIAPASAGTTTWARARDGAQTPVPLYLQNQSAQYWFEHLPEQDLVYFQLNQIASNPEEPIDQFIPRLFEYIETNNVGHLVIDLRLNGGGNSYLNSNLTDALIRAERINDPQRLFVITGRRTFSAAMNLTTDIDLMTEATLVGEPAGSRPNFIGESRVVKLPYSGVEFTCSTRMHQHGMDSTDERKLIAPDYYVPLSSVDYRLNRDPVMDTIRAIVAQEHN